MKWVQGVIVYALNAMKKHRTRMVFLARMKGVLVVEPSLLREGSHHHELFQQKKKNKQKKHS